MNGAGKRIWLPLGAGLLGMLALMGVYVGIVSWAESPQRAVLLFWEDRFFVVPILLGFGAQVGLYTVLRKGLYLPGPVAGAGAPTAASGGMSTAAMVACCAHRVADVLPIVGLSAAAAFLANWKIPFLVFGLASNLFGLAYLLRAVLKARRQALARLTALEAQA